MSFGEQIMSKDKYPSIFSLQMEGIVFILLQIFFATHAVLEIGQYHSDILQFVLVTSRDKSRGSFRPIVRERKYLMDYKSHYTPLYKRFCCYFIFVLIKQLIHLRLLDIR